MKKMALNKLAELVKSIKPESIIDVRIESEGNESSKDHVSSLTMNIETEDGWVQRFKVVKFHKDAKEEEVNHVDAK